MNASPTLTDSDHISASLRESSQQETLRCTSTADFLAALPLLTGFTDQNSLFIVLFHGRRGGNVLRMELPKTQSPHDVKLLVDGVTSLMKDTGAGKEGPAIVITTSQKFETAGGPPPWSRLTHHLKRRFRHEGWNLRELAVIAEDAWCGVLGDAPRVARPLSEITESEFARSVQKYGAAPRSLSSIGVLPQPTPARAGAVAEQLQHLKELKRRRRQHNSSYFSDRPITEIRKTAELADRCFDVAGATGRLERSTPHPERIPAIQLAQFISAAQSRTPWLVLVLTALTRAEFVVSVAHESGTDRLTDIHISDAPSAIRGTREAWSIEHLLHSLSHELPEREKLRSAVRVLEDGIVHAPPEMSPPLLAFLAWAWWMLGMQSVAARTITRALEVECDHELTLMVQRLIADPPAAHLHRLRAEYDRANARG